MKVNVTRVNDALLFESISESGASVFCDGPTHLGGVNGGLRPMEMLLSSIASCSAFDVVHILKKQRQEFTAFYVEVEGIREKVEQTTPFKEIHMVFNFSGDLNLKKVERAVELSVEKYCSVKASLHPSIHVSYEVKINL